MTGTRTQGSHAIGASHQHLFQTSLKGSQLSASITRIRFLRFDAAILQVLGETRLAEQTEAAQDRATIETAVALKEQGKWLLTALQNTRILQMPPDSTAPCNEQHHVGEGDAIDPAARPVKKQYM